MYCTTIILLGKETDWIDFVMCQMFESNKLRTNSSDISQVQKLIMYLPKTKKLSPIWCLTKKSVNICFQLFMLFCIGLSHKISLQNIEVRSETEKNVSKVEWRVFFLPSKNILTGCIHEIKWVSMHMRGHRASLDEGKQTHVPCS